MNRSLASISAEDVTRKLRALPEVAQSLRPREYLLAVADEGLPHEAPAPFDLPGGFGDLRGEGQGPLRQGAVLVTASLSHDLRDRDRASPRLRR